MPTGGVSLDNAGDWIAAGAVAVGVGTALLDATAIAAGDYAVITANAQTDRRQRRGGRGAASAAVRADPDGAKSRDVRRDHAAAQPARVRAVLPVAGARRDVRRRRGERRRQPRALRPRELLRHAAAGARDRRRRRQGAARRRACAPTSSSAAGAASASTSPRRAPASAPRPSSTTARTRRSPRCSRARWTGPTVFEGAAWFHVTGITPALGASAAACTREAVAAAQRGRRARQRRPELPQEALDRGRGAGDDAAADGVGRSSWSPTRRTCSRCSACTCRTPTSRAGS